MSDKRVLVFPKGTVVKFDGIPCELLQDTPYESATIRSRSVPRQKPERPKGRWRPVWWLW